MTLATVFKRGSITGRNGVHRQLTSYGEAGQYRDAVGSVIVSDPDYSPARVTHDEDDLCPECGCWDFDVSRVWERLVSYTPTVLSVHGWVDVVVHECVSCGVMETR